MFDIERNYDLFSFILACYKEIYACNFYDINPTINNVDLQFIIDERPSLNFTYFYECLKVKKILNQLNDKKVISTILRWIDSNIFSFNEYENIVNKDFDCSCLEDEIHYLIIQSKISIAKRIDMDMRFNNDDGFGLRDRKTFDPMKNSVRIGLKNLVFISKRNNFVLTQKFLKAKNLSNKLMEGEISFCFYPTIPLKQKDDIFTVLEHTDEKTFSIEYLYKNNKYIDTFSKAINDYVDFAIFPELVCEPKSFTKICDLICKARYDYSRFYITGTSWINNSNICYLLNENGETILKQEKNIPYSYKKTDEQGTYKVFEKLNNEKTSINLLHIIDFGIVGIVICSDLNSSKYIESIYCECGVDMLILPCFTESDDLFSSLINISQQYWITVIACNACSKGKKTALVYVPYKKHSKRVSLEFTKKCTKMKKCTLCKGLRININIKKLTKK